MLGGGGSTDVDGFMEAGVADALECLTGQALGRSLGSGGVGDDFEASLLCMGHDGWMNGWTY